MATPADDPKDVLDFKFRSIRKIRLHDEASIGEIPKEPTQKLAVANTLGKIFAGMTFIICTYSDIYLQYALEYFLKKLMVFVLNLRWGGLCTLSKYF